MTAGLIEHPPNAGQNTDHAMRVKFCLSSFRAFVREFWDTIPGSAPLKWNWHMDVLCDELQELAERVFRGLPKDHDSIFNVPPGTSKSSITLILFPAWVWARFPQARILSASATLDLVMDLAIRARAVIVSDKYREFFPYVELSSDQDTKTHYRNTAGGERLTCTVAGKSPIGFHAHAHLCDDLLDPKKAYSPVEVITARQFLTEVLPSRKVDKAVTPLVLIMQRLGVGDPTDVMLEANKKDGGTPVRHFCLPAELTEDVSPKHLRDNYVDGLLDPVRLSAAVLKQERANMPAHAYAAQYLQKPTPPGGSMFKSAGFNQRVRTAPYRCRRVFAIDRASTHDGGCYTAGVLLARDDQNKAYVEDVMRGQWEPDERNEKILEACLKYRRRYGPKHDPIILIESEGGASGKDSFKYLARKLAGFRVKEISVSRGGSKDVRAEPWADYVAALNVWLADNDESLGLGRADWDVNAFVQEHLNFRPVPGKRLGGFKDQVDAASLGFNFLFDRGAKVLPLKRIDFRPGARKGPPVRLVVVADHDELAQTIIDEPCVLVYCTDPSPKGEPDPESLPVHGCNRLVAGCVLPFIEQDAAELQGCWNEVMPGFDKKPEQVVLSKEQGRRLWGVLTRKHDPPPRMIVFTGDSASDGRPLSMAMAVCDSLRYERSEAFLSLTDSDNNYGGEPPNRHAYDVARASRSSVAA